MLACVACTNRGDFGPIFAPGVITATPAAIVADGDAEASVTLHVRDVTMAPFPGVEVRLVATGDADVKIVQPNATDAQGLATATITGTRAGVVRLTAWTTLQGSDSQLSGVATLTLLAQAPDGQASQLQAAPATVVANGSSATRLTLTVRDSASVPIAGVPVTWGVNGVGATLGSPSGSTDANGMLTNTVQSTQAGNANIVARFNGATLGVAVNFVPGAPAFVSLAADSPGSALADGIEALGLHATVTDVQGNVNPNVLVAFSGNGNLVFAPAQSSTDIGGVASSSVHTTVSGTYSITATGGGIASGPVSVSFVAGSVSNVAIVVTPVASVLANGAASFTVVATVKDGLNNPVPGALVQFQGAANVTWNPNQLSALSDGTATSHATATVAGVYAVTAKASATTSNAATITFISGPPNAATSAFTVNPNQLDTLSPVQGRVTLTLRDAFNNTCAGQAVTFNSTGAQVTFTPANTMQVTGSTSASGVFNANVTSGTVQNANLIASFNGNTIFAPVQFSLGAPSALYSSISLSPNTNVLADGNTRATATVTLCDSLGYPLPNYPLSVSSVATGTRTHLVFGATNALANAFFPVTSIFSGAKSVAAHAGGINLVASVTFIAAGPMCSSAPALGNPPVKDEYAGPGPFVAADFDLDGHLDVVVVNGSANVAIPSYGGGDALFTQYPGIFDQFFSTSIAACDFNNDTKPDIAIGCQGNNSVGVWVASNRTFNVMPSVSVAVNNGLGVSCGDLNKDGNADLISPTGFNNSIVINTGKGDGTFNPNISFAAAGAPGNSLVVDLNLDGNQDIVYTGTNVFGVAMNHGNLNFSTTTFATGGGGNAVCTALLNNDSFPDLGVSSVDGNTYIYLGTGDGNMTLKSVLALTASSQFCAFGDLNKDGHSDLVAGSTSGFTSISLGQGDGTFLSPTAYLTGSNIVRAAVGDFNEDGNQDVLVVTNSSSAGFAPYDLVLLGDGTGALSRFRSVATVANPTQLRAAYINSDARVDVVTVSNANKLLSYALNTGASFGAHTDSALVGPPVGLVTQDTDADGLDDVAVYMNGAHGAQWWHNNGSGLSAGPVKAGNGNSVGLVTADFDGNGVADLATISQDSNVLTVFLFKSDGTATVNSTSIGATSLPTGLVASDFDLDGAYDVAASFNAAPNLGVWRGRGDGTFQAVTLITGTNTTTSIAIAAADLNRDGYVDIMTADNTASASMQLQFYNNAAGTFTPRGVLVISEAGGVAMTNIATSDLDGDGRVDILESNAAGDSFMVVLDANVPANPPFRYFVGQGPGSIIAADIDGDLKLDVVNVNTGASQLDLSRSVGCLH